MSELVDSHLVTLRRIRIVLIDKQDVVIEDNFSEGLLVRGEPLPELNLPSFVLVVAEGFMVENSE